MNLVRTLPAATVLMGASAAGLAALAAVSSSAGAAPPAVVSQGEAFSIRHDEDDTGNIVGGGAVSVAGQSEGQQVSYGDSRFGRRAAGIPVFIGGSEGDVAYRPVDIAAARVAAR